MERKVNYKIIKLDPTYADEIAGIEKVCFSVPWSPETIRSEMSNGINCFYGAAGDDGKLLGYIGFQSVCDEMNVFNVAVLPSARRNGIGSSLVGKMTEEAGNRKTRVINLEVRASNLSAIGLYERSGFVFCGIRKDYYSEPRENALLMRLAFDGSQEMEDPVEIWDED